MMRAIHRLRTREEGMTLLELTIVMMLLGVVVAIFMTTFLRVQSNFDRQSDRSQSNDQARLAVEEIDREVRSGNLLYDPATENDAAHGIYPGMSLRVYTQTNAPTRDPANRCVQWRILNGELQVRSWSVTWRTDGTISTWRVVADHVVNYSNNPQTAAFVLDPESTKGSRTLVVNILVNQDAKSGKDVQVKTSVTGRNTGYGYPVDICSDIPPYS